MRILVYKRTHLGDPDHSGCFGIYDCMGKVRKWDFDAVIGVGGTGAQPRKYHIAEKVNWIGIYPQARTVPGKKGPLLTFRHFRDFGSEGPAVSAVAPALAQRLYSTKLHFLLDSLVGQAHAQAFN